MDAHIRFSRAFFAAFLSLVVFAGLPGFAHAQDGQHRDEQTTDGHRLVGLLDYIGADYGGAVSSGRVVDDFEYREQLSLLEDARAVVAESEAPDAQVLGQLERVEELVEQKASNSRVQAAVSRARSTVISRYEVVLFPTKRPDRENGEELFAKNCATCHGASGRADTPAAKAMTPQPPDFADPNVRATLSPYRAFNTVTFGVEGTPMNAFDQLSEQERWDIAFYVMSLAHRGRTAGSPDALPEALDLDRKTLAATNDADLTRTLVQAGVSEEAAPNLVSYLRTRASYQTSSDTSAETLLETTREHVEAARGAWRNGEASRARQLLLSAYLDGFEPMEARLGAVDARLVAETEREFMALRGAIERGDSRRVEAGFEATQERLDEAQVALSADESDAWTVGVASGVIILREGVEIILLLALLLGMLERLEFAEAKKYVHAGWIAAVGAGIGTWAVTRELISVSGVGRELMEGIVGLLAAAVLFSVSYWFLSHVHGEKWARFLKDKIERRLDSGNLWAIAGLSFLAVYRELFEVILYFQALFMEAGGAVSPILAGTLVAAAALAVLAYLILKTGAKLPLKPFFAVSGAALYALAIVLLGKGLHALVEAGVLPVEHVSFIEISWLGVYPEVLSLSAQAILIGLGAIWAWNALKQSTPSPAS